LELLQQPAGQGAAAPEVEASSCRNGKQGRAATAAGEGELEGKPFHRKGKIHSDKHRVASAKLRN